ncbi:MAG: sulfatase [Pirellulales bacterium]
MPWIMNRPAVAALFLLMASAFVTLASAASASAQQQNVVLFVVDDQGFQAGCYGNPAIQTPALDRLAAEGMRFTQAFCTTASCSASRSVILTGLHNHANGQYGHEHSYHHFRTMPDVRSLPVLLSEAGYRTCSIGKFHVGPEEVYHFQEYRNGGVQGNRNAVRMAQNAREFIAEDDERPFFLYFCTSDPHRGGGPGGFANFNNRPGHYPGVTPVHYDPADVVVPPWLPDQPEVRRELAEYYQAISRLDQGLGVLLNALEETGHSDDTLVLFLSDNGPPWPGAKTNLYEPGMRLPLVVRHPGASQRGRTTDAMVDWTDLAPTILDWAGLSDEQIKALNIHGRSFLPVLESVEAEPRNEVFASHTFHEITMYYPMRVIRTPRYKYILNLAHQLPYPFASDLYASPTWQGVLERDDSRYGKRSVEAYIQRPRHELYDLQEDPDEIQNLADSREHADTVRGLQEKLKDWQQRTGDPWILKYKYE